MNKHEIMNIVVDVVANELGISLIEAASKMQGQAVLNGNEQLISDLHDFKMTLLEN